MSAVENVKSQAENASKTLLYVSLALTSLSVLCNVALLGLVAYVYADMQNKYDTAFFIFGDPNSSIADMLNDKLRMNYRPVFDALSTAFAKLADAFEVSRTQSIVEMSYLCRSVASLAEMLSQLSGVQNLQEGSPVGTPAMSSGLMGNFLGIGEGSSMPMVEFLQAQGNTDALRSLGTTCKALTSEMRTKRWSFEYTSNPHFNNLGDYDYEDWECERERGFDYLWKCRREHDMTSDMRDVLDDVYDWCVELERTS